MVDWQILGGILLPFLGTTLGAACVFLLRNEIPHALRRGLLGFASGVMVAASVWSLLIPSIEQSSGWGRFAFVPAVGGVLLGTGFLLLIDNVTPHQHPNTGLEEGPNTRLSRLSRLVLAVTIHNIPEGMAVGVVYSGLLAGLGDISSAGAFALALGIAIQNFPEGAIISMPLRVAGQSRRRSFIAGTLSGAVEPIAAALTIAATSLVVPAMPWLLAFAAGAMLFVVVDELVPDMAEGEHTDAGPILFALGFALMMSLDVALG